MYEQEEGAKSFEIFDIEYDKFFVYISKEYEQIFLILHALIQFHWAAARPFTSWSNFYAIHFTSF